MYKNFYHMTEEPFQNFPLPDLFFKSRSHQSGWRYLLLGIKAREPYLLVTGEYGAGKTLLCLRLLKGMVGSPGHFPHAFISTPNSSYLDILKKIAGALGVPRGIDRESALQREILEVFEGQESPGPFFLILDDVQDLDADTLHNLRLFANFSCNGVFPFRLILFAHTSFLQRLKSPTLCSLDQRIKRRYHLASLQPEETKEYIYYRLLNSGARGRPFFNDNAVHRIHTLSDGVPRIINNLCDACLLIGVGEELGTIDERTVHRAEAYLGMPDESMEKGPQEVPGRELPGGEVPVDDVPGGDFRAAGLGGLGAGEGIDFMELPDNHGSDHLEQVVPEWEKDVSFNSRFSLGRFFYGRKGRYFLVLFLLILIFLLGFFWQRYGMGVSLGLTSSSGALPSRVDGDVAFWLEPKSVRESVEEKGMPLGADSESRSGGDDGAQPALTRPDAPGLEASAEEISFSEKDKVDDMPEESEIRTVPEVFRLSGREYTLVVSSCRKKESAIAVLDSLEETSNFDVGLGQIAYDSGAPWWVVHQGTFASRAEAVEARQALQLPDALVRKLPYLVVDSRVDVPETAEERLRWLKGRGEHPFFVNEGKWVDVCLGRYDTARRAAAQAVADRSWGRL